MKVKLAIAIISIMLVLPLISAFGTDDDLKYQVQNPGNCIISVENLSGQFNEYNINTSVRVVGSQIYRTFDGRPNLPISGNTGFGSNACARFGLNYNDLNFWDLVKYGVISGPVDTCPVSAVDPDQFDGLANLKCNNLCRPLSAVCLSIGTLASCSLDGQGITHTDCVYGCDDSINQCRYPEKNIVIQTDQDTYSLGETVNVTGTFTAAGNPIAGIPMIAQLTKSGVLSELQSTTDSNGKAYFNFPKLENAGEITVHLNVPNYLGRSFDETKVIEVVGSSINYEVATYSYTQYSSKNITFTVKMKDANGVAITPSQLTNLHAVCSLTQGIVHSGDVSYQGDGLYQISSSVSGSGSFVGKLSFNLEGTPQSSPIVTLDVRPMTISIDATGIAPSAGLNETKNYTINIVDSTGQKIDPSNIEVHVSYPDGTTAKFISFEDITKLDSGVYQFSFTFNQVEKYTFDIYADYADYARGAAKASVSVNGAGDTAPGIGGLGNLSYWFYGAIGLVIIIFIYKVVKKK